MSKIVGMPVYIDREPEHSELVGDYKQQLFAHYKNTYYYKLSYLTDSLKGTI